MSDNTFENIELYIHDELSPEERKNFEEKLRKDNTLKEQYQTYKEVHRILSKKINITEEEAALYETLERKRHQYFDQKEKVVPLKKRRKKLWLSVVSVAAAAILVFLFWNPGGQNVLSNYGQLEMTNPTVRGENQKQGMTKAAHLFNKKAYKEVLPLLDSVVQADPDNAQSLFYRGVTLLHLKREAEAQQDLKAVFEGESIYRYQAAYFMALSYLEKGDKSNCRKWLQKIPEEASISTKAKKVLDKIDT